MLNKLLEQRIQLLEDLRHEIAVDNRDKRCSLTLAIGELDQIILSQQPDKYNAYRLCRIKSQGDKIMKFHQRGMGACELNDGNITRSIGIVEDEYGQVYEPAPSDILFIDNDINDGIKKS